MAKPEESDRAIANKVKRDHKTVSKVRKNLESTGEVSPVQKRVGADGKVRKQPKARPKKTPKSKPVPVTHPDVTESPERIAGSQVIDIEQRRAEMAALADGTMGDACIIASLEKESADHLAQFSAACKKYLPHLTDEDWAKASALWDEYANKRNQEAPKRPVAR